MRVTVPRWGSKREGKLFADSQRGWIDQQLARWASETSKPREADAPTRDLLLRAKRELPVRLLQLASEHESHRGADQHPQSALAVGFVLAGGPHLFELAPGDDARVGA